MWWQNLALQSAVIHGFGFAGLFGLGIWFGRQSLRAQLEDEQRRRRLAMGDTVRVDTSEMGDVWGPGAPGSFVLRPDASFVLRPGETREIRIPMYGRGSDAPLGR